MPSRQSYYTEALVLVALASMLAFPVFAEGQDAFMSRDALIHALSRVNADLSGTPSEEQAEPAPQPGAEASSAVLNASPNAAAVLSIYKSATEDRDPASMARLAVLYREGLGVEQSYPEAIKWYSRAAAAGDADAMNDLGSLYVAGAGLQQDFTEAMKWYRHAADAGSVMAITNIAKLYYFGSACRAVIRKRPSSSGSRPWAATPAR